MRDALKSIARNWVALVISGLTILLIGKFGEIFANGVWLEASKTLASIGVVTITITVIALLNKDDEDDEKSAGV